MCVQVTSSDRPDAPCVPGPVQQTEVIEIDRGDPKENRQKLFAQSWLEQGVGHHHLCFGTDSPAGREPESFLVTKGKDPGAPRVAAVAWESGRRANQRWDILHAWEPTCGFLWLVLN